MCDLQKNVMVILLKEITVKNCLWYYVGSLKKRGQKIIPSKRIKNQKFKL
jgi:hypothetical protein